MAETRPAPQDSTASGARPRGLGEGAAIVLAIVIPFAAFLLLDGWFYAIPRVDESFPLSPFFALAPVVCLYFGWPAMIGCVAAETIVCLSTGDTVFNPVLWFVSVIIYVVLPYLLWYAINGRARDPYPRCSRAGSLAELFGIFILSSTIFALASPYAAVVMNIGAPYSWSVMTTLFLMTSITLTFGIVLLIVFEASPLAARRPRWVAAPYVQQPSLSLTQRIVLVFAAIATIALFGFVFALYVFVFTNDTDGELDFIDIIAASLVMGDVVVFVLWFFGILTLSYLQTRFTIPIERLSEATRAFPKAMADYQRAVDGGVRGEALAEARAKVEDAVDMAGLRPSGEVAYLVEDTDTMRASMVLYLNEMRSVTAENERVRTELEVAKQIQQGAVPHDFEELDKALGVQVAASMTPARDVGGDFYDAFRIDATHLGVIMADVSGKGMPAALFMMRSLADLREQMHAHPDDVGLALTRANLALCENNDAMLFVTALIGILDTETGVFSYANAGHNPAWILGPEETWLKARKGLVLGVMDMVTYRTETLQLAPGGGLFLYTDGVTEAMNPEDALYGEDRLDAVLKGTEAAAGGEAPSETVVGDVLADVHAFADGAEQSDDITALAFRWLPDSKAEV